MSKIKKIKIAALLIAVTVLNFIMISFWVAAYCGPNINIGLRVYDGTGIVSIASEPAGTLTSPLRISKAGTTYGIILVDPTDPDASRIRVSTNSGIKALRKLTAYLLHDHKACYDNDEYWYDTCSNRQEIASDCGSSYCDAFGSWYCQDANTRKRDRTCHSIGCSGNSCFNTPYTDSETVACGASETCSSGSCCTPNCAGKNCGNDGCGGSCGTCGAGQICSGGVCLYQHFDSWQGYSWGDSNPTGSAGAALAACNHYYWDGTYCVLFCGSAPICYTWCDSNKNRAPCIYGKQRGIIWLYSGSWYIYSAGNVYDSYAPVWIGSWY